MFRMEVYLQALGCDVWYLVNSGYIAPKRPPKSITKNELKKNNAMAMDAILYGLSNSMKHKLEKYTLAEDLWDKLQNLYKVEEETN